VINFAYLRGVTYLAENDLLAESDVCRRSDVSTGESDVPSESDELGAKDRSLANLRKRKIWIPSTFLLIYDRIRPTTLLVFIIIHCYRMSDIAIGGSSTVRKSCPYLNLYSKFELL